MGLAQPQAVELGGQAFAVSTVRLVRRQYDRCSGAAQQLRDVAVDRGHPLPNVDHQQDHVGLLDGHRSLLLHAPAQLPERRDLVALLAQHQTGGVDDREVAAPPVGFSVEAIPRQPGQGVHDRPPQALSIRRSRFIYGGLHERIGIQNCGPEPVDLECELLFGADFLDLFEVKADSRGQVLRYLGTPRPLEGGRHGLSFIYDGLDGITRRTEVVFHTPPTHRHEARVGWNFHLEPKQTETLVVDVIPLLGESEPTLEYLYDDALLALQRSYRHWNDELTRVSTDNAFLSRGLLRRSQMDLRILVEEFDTGLLPMAGIPWFSAPFGRDALITSIQTLMLNPEIARGTLRYLAARQGRQVDLAREEEPGKILHEIRYGELANLKQIPHTPYYGSVDSTPLFLVCAVTMMDWLDDRDLFVVLLA